MHAHTFSHTRTMSAADGDAGLALSPAELVFFRTMLSVVSQQLSFGYTVQNGSSVQITGVSLLQGNEPWTTKQKHLPLILHSVELHAHVGPMQQQGSGTSPTAQHTLHSKQQVIHSSAQPIFGGNSSAALQQQQPSTITAFEQHPMAGAYLAY